MTLTRNPIALRGKAHTYDINYIASRGGRCEALGMDLEEAVGRE